MKAKYLILFLIIILVFGFGLFTSCRAEEIIEESTEEKITQPAGEEIEEIKYSLTESERKQAFYDLIKLQDLVPLDDPEWSKKQVEAYVIIAEKYGITKDQMSAIAVEGAVKGWPLPDLPTD